MTEHHHTTGTPTPPPCIVAQHASVKHGNRIIWSQGDFTIPTGSVTAIVGTNGAGKTTMLNAELGLIPLASGTLTVLGKPAGEANAQIGYVPQTYTNEIDSSLTALQSVLLGLTGYRFGFHPISRKQRAKAMEALEYVDIADHANQRLSQLSGGMRQRVAIAQALVGSPKLLMLDEPLANLDLPSQHATVHILAKLNRELGMTIQIVAHDLNMLLPILTGAVYLLDGHPHYASVHDVLDAKLLTHLYGTTVQVIQTPQGDMFVTPETDLHFGAKQPFTDADTHTVGEITSLHEHNETGSSHANHGTTRAERPANGPDNNPDNSPAHDAHTPAAHAQEEQ
ncbi:ABC transporter ATP-binding protein [Bifidobacterium gallicum]|uniref:ABC transporter ATP-binding protein n=1 Tax=Bifidobacterium gallicum DSM 20093 = LMG 11596 TaxID=561180 RepID=D1NWU5_9BIFI|nr:ABC transporter, ATP-binding protein [Bifidobacterium gallicum DSM 20093 = LMG 11596]KFI57494.1 ABC transporter ATP-binding protein [Bifidobacterium gallicum DSM 20093 = LMG 11596]